MTTDPDSALTSAAQLGAFAASLRLSDVPSDAIRHSKLCLLDSFGCALFGSTLPWTKILTDTVADAEPGGIVPAWGTDVLLAPTAAALVNGSAVHAFELDDLHPRSIVHPGSVVIPAALALAPATGAQFLTAVVAGYEVAARVGMSVGAAHLRAGWHPTGTHGTMGAAAAASSAMALTPGQAANAIGIAGSMSAGLMAAQYESMVKRMHAGRAAQSGVYAALLARRGYTGIADLFEAPYGGYGATFSPEFEPALLTKGLGSVWEILKVGFKPYSCNGSCHPTVDALRDLRERHRFSPADVSSVDVSVSTATALHVGWPYVPATVTTAQMNLAYVAAVTLLDGNAFVEQFREDRLADPAVLALASLVRVHADPQIDAAGDTARHLTMVELTLRDGTVLRERRDHARGSAAQPMTEGEVRAKYSRLAAFALEKTDTDHLMEIVDRVEQLPDLTALTGLLSYGRRPTGLPR
jgi:2-methylcitrate dehydratase PrpD